MTPLVKIYWFRLTLGIVAAIISILYGIATNSVSAIAFDWTVFFNGLSLALVIYLLSYYGLRARYASQVAKPSKIVTTGIGVYFLTWLVFWTLLYTIFAGPAPAA